MFRLLSANVLPSQTAAAASCTDPKVKLTAEKPQTATSNKESGRFKLVTQDAVIGHSKEGRASKAQMF